MAALEATVDAALSESTALRLEMASVIYHVLGCRTGFGVVS
jgi:hypothetical protein